MRRTKRNPRGWAAQPRRHGIASHLGWAFRRKRRKGPAPPGRYLSAAGISRSRLRKYAGRRKTKASTLFKKRRRRGARKVYGMRVNPRGSYRAFVSRFIKSRHPRTPAQSRSAMRAAAKAWRSGNRNPVRRRRRVRASAPVRRRRRRSYALANPRRRRRRRSRARRNPVLPYAAFNRPRRRRRGRARRNAILPYAAFNRRSARNNPLDAVIEAGRTAIEPATWTHTVLPVGAGMFGTLLGGGVVYGLTQKVVGAQTGVLGSIQRIGCSAIASTILSGVSLMVTKDSDIAGNVLAGGLVAVGAQIIMELFGFDIWSEVLGMTRTMEGLAMDLTDELKQRIANSVRGSIQAAEGAPIGTSAFVSTQELMAAPSLGPGPNVAGMGDFATTQGLSTAPQFAASEAPVVADLDVFSHSGMDQMLV